MDTLIFLYKDLSKYLNIISIVIHSFLIIIFAYTTEIAHNTRAVIILNVCEP